MIARWVESPVPNNRHQATRPEHSAQSRVSGQLACSSLVGRGRRRASMEHEMSGFTFPSTFTTHEIATREVTIYTRVGGTGPAVVLLHGYGETGDMWVPLAVDLARDHTVIVPDLRGLGRSS